MSLGDKVRAVREGVGLSRKDFGKRLHVSESWIGLIENNKKVPSDSLLDAIMYHFNVSVDWWETGEGFVFDRKQKLPVDKRRELAHAEFDRVYDMWDDAEQMKIFSEFMAFLAERRKGKV